MEYVPKNVSDIQKERIKKLIDAGKIDEIYKAMQKLPISNQEKTVLIALTSRELVKGLIGNTASEIRKEIAEVNDESFKHRKIGTKLWTILNQLTEKRLIQTIEGFPKIFVLNRQLNPIRNITYPYSLLESLYEILPKLNNFRKNTLYRVTPEKMMSPSSGVYSTNKDFFILLNEMIELAKKEILATSLLAKTYEDSPISTYILGNAIERGISIYYLLSDKAPPDRINKLKEIGVNVKIVKAGILRQNNIPNIQITDNRHFISVDKYKHKNEQKVRFGFWCKYNKKISQKYAQSFWKVWKSKRAGNNLLG